MAPEDLLLGTRFSKVYHLAYAAWKAIYHLDASISFFLRYCIMIYVTDRT